MRALQSEQETTLPPCWKLGWRTAEKDQQRVQLTGAAAKMGMIKDAFAILGSLLRPAQPVSALSVQPLPSLCLTDASSQLH